MDVRVEVDEDLCCAYGTCVDLAPDLFTLEGESDAAEPKMNPVPEQAVAAAEAAALECPTRALRVIREPGA